MKIIINTPKRFGGVSNHFNGLEKYWNKSVHYNYIGGRYNIPGSIILGFDLLKFIFKIINISPEIVLLNPSLGVGAIKRDTLFLKISKLFNIPVVVFFHGWDEKVADRIDGDPKSFVKRFDKADAFIVLANEFKERMINWGFHQHIYLTTTKVDDRLLDNFGIGKKVYGKNVLFLARIEKEKGVYTAIKVFNEIIKECPDSSLTIAGDGTALNDVKSYVLENNIKNVSFTGFISGNKLADTFSNADLYLFPTEHGEGMPASVLEAMAFGLPIITRPVGGLVDFFENGKMGYMINTSSNREYIEKSIQLLKNCNKLKSVSIYNHNYAKRKFFASEVVKSLEEMLTEVIHNTRLEN